MTENRENMAVGDNATGKAMMLGMIAAGTGVAMIAIGVAALTIAARRFNFAIDFDDVMSDWDPECDKKLFR